MPGVLRLALFQARRDRVTLPVWILGITLLGFATSSAVVTQFGDEPSQAAILTLAATNPAFLFLRGLPDGTGIGAVVFFQGYAFTAVLAGLMSTFLVVRHTRTDEELGRAEVLGSVPLPRAASLAATLLLGAAANLILAMFLAAGFVAAGLPVPGAVGAGAAVGAVGVFFVGLAAAVAQVLPSGRSANGAAAGLVGAAYLLRGVGDALGTPASDLLHVSSAWPSLLSPIGWGQRLRPFTSPDLFALPVLLAAALGVAVAAVLIRRRRDVGASLLPQRDGRERAGAGGTSFVGLAWRLQRSTLAGWCVGAAALGAVAGALGPLVSETVSSVAPLKELISRLVPGGQAGLIDVFVTALLGVAGVFAAAAGIQAVLRMRAEEAEGRAEALLAAPVSRAPVARREPVHRRRLSRRCLRNGWGCGRHRLGTLGHVQRTCRVLGAGSVGAHTGRPRVPRRSRRGLRRSAAPQCLTGVGNAGRRTCAGRIRGVVRAAGVAAGRESVPAFRGHARGTFRPRRGAGTGCHCGSAGRPGRLFHSTAGPDCLVGCRVGKELVRHGTP